MRTNYAAVVRTPLVLAVLVLAVPGPSAVAETIIEFPIPTPNSAPNGITTGPDGNLRFTERFANRIGRITPSGMVTGEFLLPSPLSNPGDITAGSDGNLWFTEDLPDRIGRITTGGVITEFNVTSVGGRGVGITVGPDGNIWFTGETTIGRITPGSVLTEFPIPTDPILQLPGGIVTGPDGRLWFTIGTSTTLSAIGRINPDGTGFTTFTTGLTADSSPYDITLGPDGNLWFTEFFANTIGRITPSGIITEFPFPAPGSNPGFAGITTGPDGNVYFTSPFSNQLWRYDPVTDTFTDFTLPVGSLPGPGITVGPDGNIWFTESGRNNIARLTLQTIPAPSTLTLFSLGAFGLLGYAWRRRRRA